MGGLWGAASPLGPHPAGNPRGRPPYCPSDQRLA